MAERDTVGLGCCFQVVKRSPKDRLSFSVSSLWDINQLQGAIADAKLTPKQHARITVTMSVDLLNQLSYTIFDALEEKWTEQ